MRVYRTINKKRRKELISPENFYLLAQSITRASKSFCKIIFLIFDINKKDTFVELKKYIEKINEILGKDKTIINILGNKINTNEKQNAHVTNEEGEKYAKEVGAIYEMISLDDSNSLQNIIKKNIQKCL